MSEDIVRRLRRIGNGRDWPDFVGLVSEAADEIESLRKQLAAFYRRMEIYSGHGADVIKREIDQGLNPAQSAGD